MVLTRAFGQGRLIPGPVVLQCLGPVADHVGNALRKLMYAGKREQFTYAALRARRIDHSPSTCNCFV